MKPRAVLLLAALAFVAGCSAQTPKDDNALACDSFRRHIGDTGQAFTDLGKGTITVADAVKSMQSGQKNATDYASFAHGTVQASLTTVADDLGRIRVAMIAQGEAGLTTPMADGYVADIHATDAACAAIKH